MQPGFFAGVKEMILIWLCSSDLVKQFSQVFIYAPETNRYSVTSRATVIIRALDKREYLTIILISHQNHML